MAALSALCAITSTIVSFGHHMEDPGRASVPIIQMLLADVAPLRQEYRQCAAYYATTSADQMHYKYFLKQQEAEELFLEQVSSELCTIPYTDVEDTIYQATLQRFLGPMRNGDCQWQLVS